MSVERFV